MCITISTCIVQDLQVLQNHALKSCYDMIDAHMEHMTDLHENANIKMLEGKNSNCYVCIQIYNMGI